MTARTARNVTALLLGLLLGVGLALAGDPSLVTESPGPVGSAAPDTIGDGPDGFPGFARCWEADGLKICAAKNDVDLMIFEPAPPATKRETILPSEAGELLTLTEEIAVDAVTKKSCYDDLGVCSGRVQSTCASQGCSGGSSSLTTCQTATGAWVQCCQGSCTCTSGKKLTVTCMGTAAQ